jgi:protein involved in polysaccharide export with SLBB domain
MDKDGHLDVVGGAASPGTVAVWYGDGNGGMSAPQFLPIKGDVRSVVTADFNQDGLNDIAFSVRREASGIMVWLNQPGRGWVRGGSPIEGNTYEGLAASDINDDGHPDIAAANATSDAQGGVQMWLGDGKGTWPVESGPSVTGMFMDAVAGDFNQDGLADIAGAGWGTYGSLKIWFGNGSGRWVSSLDIASGSFYGLTVTDLNEDGTPDILAGTYQQGVRIFLGRGGAGFEEIPGPVQTGAWWKALAADLDGDGVRDILASSPDGQGVRAWKFNPPDHWVPLENLFPSAGDYYGLAIADVNNDGRNDVFGASFGEGVRLWPGKGGASAFAGPPGITADSDGGNGGKSEPIEQNDVFTTQSGFSEYKIGPGDMLEITLWKRSEGTKEEILVRPDGKISFGFVEDLDVKGLTANQLDTLLTEDIKRYIKNPRLDVVVKKYQSKFVTFVGEVYTNINFRSGPGKYELTGKTTLLEMLSRIGGPTQNANLRDVRVRNKNGQSFSADLYQTINFGDTSQDAILNDGDLVFIPAITKEANRVYVFGEVAKPGVYTFSGSEMLLFDAVSQAGGLTVFATPESTRIVRGDITRPEVLEADLKALMEDGDRTQNAALINGDLVYVPRGVLGDVNVFFKQIQPVLEIIYAPARIRDIYDE